MIEVTLDSNVCSSFAEPDAWAVANCASYRGLNIVDVSDFYDADEIAVYNFDNTADAAWFTMQWRSR